MVIKFAFIIFCSCLLILYIGQVCYPCIESLMNFWFAIIFLSSFFLIIIKLAKTEEQNDAQNHINLPNMNDIFLPV